MGENKTDGRETEEKHVLEAVCYEHNMQSQ